ncbi:hypothetical protein [Ornithobacterium rhinotracheale]|uniref:hypothetical protein n=1 Tax=Ornithobacterium rhinotracheale TaxID=28251 RepID=UPI0040357339
MKKYTLLLLIAGTFSYAQVKLNQTPTLDKSSNAFLDASENTEGKPNVGRGLLFPQTDLSKFNLDKDAADGINYPTYFDGMIVYNTQEGGKTNDPGLKTQTENLTKGFYYFSNPKGKDNGSISEGRWLKISDAQANLWINDASAKVTKLKTLSDGITKRPDDKNVFVTDEGKVGIGVKEPEVSLDVKGRYLRVSGEGDEGAYIGGDNFEPFSGAKTDVQLGSTTPEIKYVTLWNATDRTTMSLLADEVHANKVVVAGHKAHATLDINANGSNDPQGILIPRISPQQLLDMQVGAEQNALLVYVTDAVEDSKRIGAFTDVDSRGFYHYYADSDNSQNNYWKKINEQKEVRPVWTFVDQIGLSNDIGIKNYYNQDGDGANFVIQNYLGSPANIQPLPANPKKPYVLGGVHFRGKLGGAFDSKQDGQELDAYHLSGINSYYYGIDENTKEPRAEIEMFLLGDMGIYLNKDNNRKIMLMSYKASSPIVMEGKLTVPNIPSYNSDREADADNTLPSGGFYKLNNGRQLYIKP